MTDLDYAFKYRDLLDRAESALDSYRASADLDALIATLNALMAEFGHVEAAHDARLESEHQEWLHIRALRRMMGGDA